MLLSLLLILLGSAQASSLQGDFSDPLLLWLPLAPWAIPHQFTLWFHDAGTMHDPEVQEGGSHVLSS